MDYTVHGVAKSRHDWATFTSQALPGKNTGVGNHFLLQGIFLTQGSNPGLLLGRQILYYCATWEALLMVSVYSQSGPTICYPMDCSTPASLSITNSRSLLKLLSIKSVMPSNHLILSVIPLSSRLQSFPASGSFPMSQFFTSGGQSIGVSASASVLPMNMQDWFALGWIGWITLLSKGFFLHRLISFRASLVAQLVKNPPAMWETWVQSLGWEDPLGKRTATHSSILAQRITQTV